MTGHKIRNLAIISRKNLNEIVGGRKKYKIKIRGEMDENVNVNTVHNAQLKAQQRVHERYRQQRKEILRKQLKIKQSEKNEQLISDAVKSTNNRLKLMKKHFIENLTSEIEYVIANQPNAMASLRVKAVYMTGLQNKMIHKIRRSIDQNFKLEQILSAEHGLQVIRR
uniref:Uncharacterized protein n=1 Tax=Trichobilharzia regenti TaxID=157069 RepID=A0AA85JMR2_TRIRE|nr:unnamed protein product [Trichobilharzia regenti]